MVVGGCGWLWVVVVCGCGLGLRRMVHCDPVLSENGTSNFTLSHELGSELVSATERASEASRAEQADE